MVTNSKPDFNNIEKASQIMMGIIMEFHVDGTRQGIFKTKPYTIELPLFNCFTSLIFTKLLIFTSNRSNFVLN